jgi:oligo-1,6-glucosidase
MRFWLDKGIDGFRMDAFQYVSKDTTFPELPEGYEKNIIKYYGMGPNLHPYLRELNRDVLSKYDVMTVAEGAGSTYQDAIDLVHPDSNELDMVYHFQGIDLGSSLDGYELTEFKKVYSEWDSVLAGNGWNSIFLANHDQPRMVSKYGNDSPEFRAPSSKMLTTFILSMRGTSYYYYGDELGMTNNEAFQEIGDFQDIAARNSYEGALERGEDMDNFMAYLRFMSRDNGRTPMQWNDTEHAGFTDGEPWLMLNPNYEQINVEAQEDDPNSVLNYFRRMAQFRQKNPVLVYGDYELLFPDHEQVYAYTRSLDGKELLVMLNFSEEEVRIDLPQALQPRNVVINNYENARLEGSNVTLEPYQAVIWEM